MIYKEFMNIIFYIFIYYFYFIDPPEILRRYVLQKYEKIPVTKI